MADNNTPIGYDTGGNAIYGFGGNPNAGASQYNGQAVALDKMMTPQPTVTVPQPNYSTGSFDSAVSGITAGQQSVNDYIKLLTPEPTAASNMQNDFLAQIAGLTSQNTGKEAYQIQQENQLGLPDLQTQLTKTQGDITTKTAEYAALDAQYQKDIANAEATSRSAFDYSGTSGAIQRQNQADKALKASELTQLYAQQQALQGNIANAQSLAQRAVDLKYQPIEDNLKVLQAQLDAIQPILDKEQQTQALAQQQYLQDRSQQIAEQKANEKAISDMITNALPQGAPQDLVNLASQAKTPLEAAKILGKYSGEYLKYELLKEQIKTEKAQQNKIYAGIQTDKDKATVDGWVANIQSGKAKLADVPSAYKNAVSAALSTAPAAPSELKTDALTSAKALLEKFNASGGSAAVGKSRLFGLQYVPGSKTKDFEIQFNNLKSLLSLDNIKYLKGQGQISDAERQLLADASSKLNLAQSEEEFKSTLESVVRTLNVGQDARFSEALGGINPIITGTSIIGGFYPNGKFNFTIPNFSTTTTLKVK